MSTTLQMMRDTLTDAYRRAHGPDAGFELPPDFEYEIEDMGIGDDDELEASELWALFGFVVQDFPLPVHADNPLMATFLTVILGPYPPEEEFLDPFEFQEMFADAEFPEPFHALLQAATACHTLMDGDPPEHLALWTNDGGWALVYPDRIQQFETPFVLLDDLYPPESTATTK